MYYSSESSDSEVNLEPRSNKNLDLSYLMLDTDDLGIQLRNSIIKQVSDKTDANESSEDRPNSASGYYPSIKSAKIFSRIELDNNESEQIFDTTTEKLYLQHNLLLVLPFELVLFSNIKVLDLSNNNLSDLNDYILNLPNLQTLYVKNNYLGDGSLPKDLTGLSNLRELNMSGNILTRVPEQLYEIQSLKYIYLGSNQISEIPPGINALKNLQVLHLGGNQLQSIPEEFGDLAQLNALILCDNQIRRLPRVISQLTRLRSLLLHRNNMCCLPVEIVKLEGLTEISLRDNPLVTGFINSCARDLMFNPPGLLELAARTINLKNLKYQPGDLPMSLEKYLKSGHLCVNPKCKGMYFTSCVQHIKFVDFCGMYRVPLMHFLCSSRCNSQTPVYYRTTADSESDDDEPSARIKRVLLG